MIEIMWMAIGLGAVYGLGTILALLAYSAENHRGVHLVLISIFWLPFMLLLGLLLPLQRIRGIGPVTFRIGTIMGTLRLGPTFRNRGFAFVRMYTEEEKEKLMEEEF